MLVAMVGLPGSGKSTLAAQLATALGGIVLCKDVVRATLFPAPTLDYSSAQDEIAMSAVYQAAGYILRAHPAVPVFLDGRTFSKPGQLGPPLALAASLGRTLHIIECACAPEVARARLAADHRAGTHPAGNRTPEMYDRVRAAAVPLTVPRLTLDTGALTPQACVSRAIAFLTR
ncbi:MAG TPA: AAA family ATPase [Gemmata sp.]